MLRELEELSARIEVLLGGWILSLALTREAITSPLKRAFYNNSISLSSLFFSQSLDKLAL
jgi:hypothetical protein